MDNIGLTVIHISWAYQTIASKTADNRGLTVLISSKIWHLDHIFNIINYINDLLVSAGSTSRLSVLHIEHTCATQ